MQYPPDPYNMNSRPAGNHNPPSQAGDGKYIPLPMPHMPLPQENALSAMRMPTYQQYSSQNAGQSNLRLRRSGRQKLFIMLAFLLTSAVVISIPVFAFQQFANFNPFSVNSGFNAQLPTTKIGQTQTRLSPMGKTILPLNNQIMTGVSMPGDIPTIDNFEKDAGKQVSILLLYQAWGDKDNATSFPNDWTNKVRQHGAIPMITWEPWAPADYPQGIDEPDYSLANITNGKFDTYITQWAKEAKAWRNPFFLRFAPEMNGNWTPWSEGFNGNVAGDYVQAWKHVHDIFTANGVTNASWVWCPNIDNTDQAVATTECIPAMPMSIGLGWTALTGERKIPIVPGSLSPRHLTKPTMRSQPFQTNR